LFYVASWKFYRCEVRPQIPRAASWRTQANRNGYACPSFFTNPLIREISSQISLFAVDTVATSISGEIP
jgi:hypothetical protein